MSQQNDKHPSSRQKREELVWVRDTKCPACNGECLFVGKGGYITCSYLPCPNPDYNEALKLRHEQEIDEAERQRLNK